jgi:hypothetical protein
MRQLPPPARRASRRNQTDRRLGHITRCNEPLVRAGLDRLRESLPCTRRAAAVLGDATRDTRPLPTEAAAIQSFGRVVLVMRAVSAESGACGSSGASSDGGASGRSLLQLKLELRPSQCRPILS